MRGGGRATRRRAGAGALLALALLAAPVAGRSQEAAPEAELPAFGERVEVRVVDVEVYVTDRDGNPVSDLERDDFELRVDGREVEITNFYREAAAPPTAGAPPGRGAAAERFLPLETAGEAPERRLFLTVMVDHTRLRNANRERAFAAIEKMISEQLEPDDLVAVVSYDGSLVFHSDFIHDRVALGFLLDDLSRTAARTAHQELEHRQIVAELSRGQSGGFLGRTSTEFLDSGSLLARIRAYAAEEYQLARSSLAQLEHLVGSLAGLPGRKAILYVSDGIPTRPGEELFNEFVNRVGEGNFQAEPGLRRFDFDRGYERDVGNYDLMRDVERLGGAANEAEVTIHALDAESDHAGHLRSALTEQGAISSTLSIAADNLREPLETAAELTGGRRIQASGRLDEHLAGLARQLATFYSLGFTPPDDWEPGESHDIEVEVRRRKLVVRHRDEVRLSGPDELAAQATVSTLLFHAGENPLGVSLHPEEARPREDGNVVMPVVVDIPVGRLALVPLEEVHAARLTFFVSVRDRSGAPGAVQRIPFHLEIPADKLEDARGRSAHYPLPLVVRPGDRQVAVGVRDEVAGTMSTLRLDLDGAAGAAPGTGTGTGTGGR